MMLFYHADSDALYWSDEWDGVSEEVTSDKRFLQLAHERGIARPVKAEPHTMAKAITESYKKWDRKPADVYPTPVDATESLIPILDVLIEHQGILHRGECRIWEPACGDGRLARVLEYNGFHVESSDLRDYSGYGTGGFDFINDDPMKKWGWMPDPNVIITNPPFSLARQFIEKACSLAPVVIMLVKQSYWNTKGRLELWDTCRPTYFLPITWRLAFLKSERGNSPLMDCAWVIWVRGMDEECFFEPMRKRAYAGYHDIGVRSATEILEGEIVELTAALSKLLPSDA